jgi:flavin reductase (DIM6/NTAB) family NADH-FMN oxidoreductase RutF
MIYPNPRMGQMLDLREVMRRWATGVTIVTAENNGQRHGATVSSLTSISVDPPLITVAIARGTRTHHLMQAAGKFGVTILAAQQQDLSERFAGALTEDTDRFEGLGYEYIQEDIPVLIGGIATMGCLIDHIYDMPKSTLFIGRVVSAVLGEDEPPLIYLNRTYRRLEE